MNDFPRRVKVCEMGPRDGLQNESGIVATQDKIRYVDLLTDAGFPFVEVTSFVRRENIPQLGDASEVFAAIARRPGVAYPCLVPNLRGFERAREAGVREIAVFTAASETFTQRNINMSIARSLDVFRAIVRAARADGMWVRAYVSTAFGCPYEGAVAVDSVVRVTGALAEMGVDEISIGDTIGVGTPNQVTGLATALQSVVPFERLAMHFHDTRGTALANVYAALQCNVTTFDAASGGLGGCPYAPGAAGNLATEDLLYMLHGMGIETGVDLEKVRAATRFVARALDKEMPSRAYRAFEAADERRAALASA